ncbi:hypothetical protein [Vibrio vulnificus]|uniref:hypothetical protein n=1 Tax=Vibrio vulnificus TaxID=672 RepID=UPI0040581773
MEDHKYKWLYVSDKDIEQKFDALSTEVLKDTGLLGKIKIDEPEQLKALIHSYKVMFNTADADEYFKSKHHRLAYFLANSDLAKEDVYKNELKITRVHYKEQDLAKKWKRSMSHEFHSDKQSSDFDTSVVMSAINRIYKRLVGDA